MSKSIIVIRSNLFYSCREKSDNKLNDLKDEYKKQKIKLKKTLVENNQLQHELIDAKNQLHGIRSKFDTIADRVCLFYFVLIFIDFFDSPYFYFGPVIYSSFNCTS